MKKTLLTIFCILASLLGMAQNETVYTEPLLVIINDETPEPQDANIVVQDNGNGTINFVLKNFILKAGADETPIGNICVENLAYTVESDGLKHFSFTGSINIQNGDQAGVSEWYGPLLGPIPVVLQGKLNDEKLYVTIDIDMQSVLQQMIHVQLGTDDFVASKVYTEQLLVIINDETPEPQDANIVVQDNGNGTINFVLKNFILKAGADETPIGNICVENLAYTVESDGLKHFSYTGSINIQNGDQAGVSEWYGPLLGPIPVVLQGKLNDEKLYVTIDIDMQSVLQQMIHVQLGTDDFVAEVTGDLNNDGSIDISDAVVVLDAMASDVADMKFDLNKDNAVDISDFVVILDLMAQQ